MAEPGGRKRQNPPAWGLLFTGLFTGLILGVLGSFLAYSAGLLPPLEQGTRTAALAEDAAADEAVAARQQLNEDLEQAAAQLQLEFYSELPNYEVIVNTPVTPAESPRAPTGSRTASPGAETRREAGDGAFMLQAGAFQQESAALQQRQRLADLGIEASVKKEALLGKTLFLVQTGPFYSRDSVNQTQRLLQRNNIDSMRVGLN